MYIRYLSVLAGINFKIQYLVNYQVNSFRAGTGLICSNIFSKFCIDLFINSEIPVESAQNFNGRMMNVGTSYTAGS